MEEHRKFLADRLLSEEQPITYRLLSRALNIHVNTAKQMLYDFHQHQNTLRANSIHATYLIYGIKGAGSHLENGDVEMTNSIPDSDSEDVTTTTLTLVGEENMKDVLSQYQEVTSLHVHSLAPHPLKDLTLLSDVARAISEYTSKEDPTKSSKTYGTISNSQIRRRDTKNRRSAPPATAKPKPKPAATITAPKSTQAAKLKQEDPATASKTSTPTSSAGKSATPSLKRGGSGGIMQSFAKAAAKPTKPKDTVKKEEETTAALSDDGEADDMDIVPAKKDAVDAEAARKTRKEREDELRRMMEEDDEDEGDEAEDEKEPTEEEAADAEMEDAPEPDSKPGPEQSMEAKEEREIISSSANGRRRGRRRVMKKERKLDEQGYMVTIQTPGWESFSEDDAPPPAKKATPASTPSSSAGSKAKKPAAKAGQGSIMSFFAKK